MINKEKGILAAWWQKLFPSEPPFKPETIKARTAELFFKIQEGWSQREIDLLIPFLAPHMAEVFNREILRLKVEGKINIVSGMTLREIEIQKSWLEAGIDFVNLRISATALDFEKDDRTGETLSGDPLEPVTINEVWTLSRPSPEGEWVVAGIRKYQEQKKA